ncbi:fibronectin type III domain-containing protein 7 isoform X2 [Denticeps clupeoides]|uniref:fibronectin type III domain-containing protein 7 isoform X2 n=1 Tax=Denticeps clupeoides TaxID=299321 RepID=UPI0010A545E8|nr:fibronectin type III domain-containing protein 7 isoform X2 [Denticeps clupeoides]
MGPKYSILFKCILLSTGLCKICSAQNDLSVSVFTVTSKSMTVQWSGVSGASSYKVTATPKSSPETPVFAQFSKNTAMGSVSSLSPNTVYIMRVEAMDNSINVLSSAETEETTAPEVPSIQQAYSKQSNSITVEFGEVSGATGYVLRAQSDDEEFFAETSVRGSPGTVLNLQPYTTYTISLMSVNRGGRSQPSLPVTTKTVVVAPALNTTSPSNDTIVVTWEPVQHAVLYSLCIIKEGSDTRVKLNTTNTSVTLSNLEAGTTYCIKGTALDPAGRVGDDLTMCQITRPPIPVEIHVTLSPTRTIGMAVSWGMVRGADYYVASTSIGHNCTSNVELYCTISTLNCSQIHYVTVIASNQAGPSGPSSPQEFLTFPCPPEEIWVEEPNPGNCSVRWTNVTFADFYIAYVKRDDGSEQQCNTTSTVCYFSCPCGYTFFSSVFSYNQAGPSTPGAVLKYTTVPCCPEDVSVSLISTETLEINWTPVRGAELYETIASDRSEVILCNDTEPVCALSDLTCDRQYSVVVRSCSEISGCNVSCRAHNQETAPCAPEILNITQKALSHYTIQWSAANTQANYTVSVAGQVDTRTCQSRGTFCEVPDLPCGTSYEVSAYATTAAGRSLPSYSVPLETQPCCPQNLTVEQITQSMTQVTWSAATGAWSYITSLTSAKGYAKCHAVDTYCIMGCITCGTNYTVNLEAISRTGACCPSSVRLYRNTDNKLRVFWRSSSNPNNYVADIYGSGSNYTCSPPMGSSSCDVSEITCGDVYTVVVAPLSQDGSKIKFCPRRMYSVSCSGNNLGMVIYRGKRSID